MNFGRLRKMGSCSAFPTLLSTPYSPFYLRTVPIHVFLSAYFHPALGEIALCDIRRSIQMRKKLKKKAKEFLIKLINDLCLQGEQARIQNSHCYNMFANP